MSSLRDELRTAWAAAYKVRRAAADEYAAIVRGGQLDRAHDARERVDAARRRESVAWDAYMEVLDGDDI